MTLLVGLLQSNPLLREELINISLAGHSLDLKPWSLLIPPTVWSVRSVLLLTRRCLMPPHGSHFNSNCLSTGTLQKKILKQYFEFKMDEFYNILTNFPLCIAKSKWVIPLPCWAFKLILTALSNYFPLVQQHQIVLLYKPYETRFFRDGKLILFWESFSKN